jgi:FkbM family methyltransferase
VILDTRRLFIKLLSQMRISAICDVGSMNGAEAMAFRAALPDATIFAFEPNPANFRLMLADHAIMTRDILPVPLAASDYNGDAEFYLVDADYSQVNDFRGLSSLYPRSNQYSPVAVVPVRTTRLDTFLADKGLSNARLALWIDAEGKAYEVMDGARGISAQVQLIHIEVENAACINANQKLYAQVRALSCQLGFVAIATDQPPDDPQLNVLFIRREALARMRWWIALSLARAWSRRRLLSITRRICPGCLRRYQAVRAIGRHDRGKQ